MSKVSAVPFRSDMTEKDCQVNAIHSLYMAASALEHLAVAMCSTGDVNAIHQVLLKRDRVASIANQLDRRLRFSTPL